MKARIIPALAVILIMVSGASVAAGDAVVPFQADYHGSCQVLGHRGGVTSAEVWGWGQNTHLGDSYWFAQTNFDGRRNPMRYWSNDITFTAANGDQLFGTMEGTFTFPEAQGTFEITGGTGRFAGVTGSGTFWGWTDGSGSNEHMYYNGMLNK